MKEPEVVEEAALIAGLKLGNDAAFETLVRSQSARMLCVARHFLGDTEEARDAVQEAFVSAFKAIERFEGGSRLSTWLHQITVNACLMRLRSRRRKPEEPIEDLLPTYLADGHHAVPPSEWSMRADELVHREETRAFVRECIERLPDSYRSVLLLRDIEELDTAEVAGLLGISENAVKTRLHRARQALRTLLSSRYGKASS